MFGEFFLYVMADFSKKKTKKNKNKNLLKCLGEEFDTNDSDRVDRSKKNKQKN